MYSTLEKTIILKSVELFKSIPAENLSKVAQITEEVKYSKDEPIFSEGDYGDSLFIVVDGEVKIHKGQQELALLKKGACLVDVGINRIEIDGKSKIVGDVNQDSVTGIASSLTPVPKGVGPMTIAMLVENTVLSAELLLN